jgi:uncharacterized repeat protein (TIGR03803 family)
MTALLIFPAYAAAQPPGPAFRALHAFGGPGDGSEPSAGVTIGIGGVLYGTTPYGGSSNGGTVYSLTPPTSAGGAWTETVLYNFTPLAGGFSPYTALVAGKGGVLYGVAYNGGASNFGAVFSLSPPASAGGAWTYSDLYDFTGGSDGALPNMLMGHDGVLYGTTEGGAVAGNGVVYSLTPPASSGGSWTQTTLYEFTGGSDGSFPNDLAIGEGGVLYGTAYHGGTAGDGAVFSLTPPASAGGDWTQAVLYSFGGGSDGDGPAGVTIGSGGVLYGTTYYQGTTTCCGTIFALKPPISSGSAWTEDIIYHFLGGASTSGKIVIGAGGVIYGSSQSAGTVRQPPEGTVFSLTPPASAGGPWTETVLHTFIGTDGNDPYGGVVMGSDGSIYGTTMYGGPYNGGVAFKVTP